MVITTLPTTPLSLWGKPCQYRPCPLPLYSFIFVFIPPIHLQKARFRLFRDVIENRTPASKGHRISVLCICLPYDFRKSSTSSSRASVVPIQRYLRFGSIFASPLFPDVPSCYCLLLLSSTPSPPSSSVRSWSSSKPIPPVIRLAQEISIDQPRLRTRTLDRPRSICITADSWLRCPTK